MCEYQEKPISNPQLNGQKWIFGSILETYPNPEYIGIHTRAPLCDNHQYYGMSDRDPEAKGFSIMTSALIRGLEEIVGVTEVNLRPHRVSIQRSRTYTWEEILEKALPVFVSYCPAHF